MAETALTHRGVLMVAPPSNDREILVVDSDRSTRNWLRALLEKAGYHVETATEGAEALARVKAKPPRMMVLETSLPKWDGLELCRQIRNAPAGQEIWIVILSGKDSHEDIVAGIVAGADDYITKHPGAHVELVAKAQTMMARDRTVHQTAPAGTNGKPHGRIISFYSAKGGSGTTAVTVNAAFALHQFKPQSSTLLADLVLPLGSVGPLVGFQSNQTIAKLTNEAQPGMDVAWVAQYISPIRRHGLSVLLSANDLQEAQTLEVKQIAPLFTCLTALYDYVCVDLGHSLSRITLPVVELSDLIIVIVTPDVNAVSLTGMSLEYLAKLKIRPERIVLIQNRTVPRVWMSREDIERELKRNVEITLPYDGEQMPQASNSNVPYLGRYAQTGVAMGLQELARIALARVESVHEVVDR